MKTQISSFVLLVFLSASFTWISCDNDSGTSPEGFNIVGTWEVTSIEGASTVDASNSTWNFKADGTYDWFLLLGPFDLSGIGTYSLSGNTLTCTGIIINVTDTDKINLTISNNNNTFSFLNNDGERWTYNRTQ